MSIENIIIWSNLRNFLLHFSKVINASFSCSLLIYFYCCRFVLEENINSSTDVSLFAIFDGHGGEYAAQFAKDILIQNLYNKIIESRNLIKNPRQESSNELTSLDKDDLNCGEKNAADELQVNQPLQRKLSSRKLI